jgi:hypothetical protein
MSNGIQVGSGVMTGNTVVYDGTTFYQWNFNAEVNGEAGVLVIWVDSSDYATAYLAAEWYLGQDPSLLEGIGQNDGTDGLQDDNEDDDGGLSDGEGSDYGESA